MWHSESVIALQLERLRRLAASDFAAVAVREQPDGRLRWALACGSRSERYKQMTLRPGIGPAGLALRTGMPVNWDDRSPPDTGALADCPLMAAEQLRCAAAFPVTRDDRPVSVVLLARRSNLPYTESDMRAALHAIRTLP